MRLFVVHHPPCDTFDGNSRDIIGELLGMDEPVDPDRHRPVFAMDATSLEDLYVRTNSLDAPWTDRAHFIATDREIRSTSCGDIAVDVAGGRAWWCAAIGWRAFLPHKASSLRDQSRSFLTSHGMASHLEAGANLSCEADSAD